MVKNRKRLERNDYNNVDLKWHIFDGESHYSVWSANIRKLYPD
jgi:hypothetical protein